MKKQYLSILSNQEETTSMENNNTPPVEIKRPKFPPSSFLEEEIKTLVNQSEIVSEDDKESLYRLLMKNQRVFCRKLTVNPETSQVPTSHSILLLDPSPIRERPCRQTQRDQEVTSKEINKMLEQHVIQFSTSPWAAPVHLIPKKDGSIRFCIDYRKLNLQTKKDVYPLPRIDDILDSLGKAKIRSKLDLTSGYWQIPVHPDDQEKTAFVTRDGLFKLFSHAFWTYKRPSNLSKNHGHGAHRPQLEMLHGLYR